MIAYQSETRKKANENYEKTVPDAEILLPTPVEDPFSGWETYEANNLSFKFPPGFIVEERGSGFFVIAPEDYLSGFEGISVDTRVESSYEEEVARVKQNLADAKIENIENGVKISGEIEKGEGAGIITKGAVLRGNERVIGIESIDPNINDEFFNQILSTFEFLEE